MSIDLQPHLENDLIELVPIQADDFERLFAVAADPAIWANHPIKDRYKRARFESFFTSAIDSKTGLLIVEKATQQIIGSVRFYDFDAQNRSMRIGYLFLAVRYWGRGFNKSVKMLMFDYAFQFVDTITFHIGVTNVLSQKAFLKFGVIKIGEEEKNFGADTPIQHLIFALPKAVWEQRKAAI